MKVSTICEASDDGNGDEYGKDEDEVKNDDDMMIMIEDKYWSKVGADLKSPELVLIILMLALHVAIPDHHQHHDHHCHLDDDFEEGKDLSPARVVSTLPPSSAVSR